MTNLSCWWDIYLQSETEMLGVFRQFPKDYCQKSNSQMLTALSKGTGNWSQYDSSRKGNGVSFRVKFAWYHWTLLMSLSNTSLMSIYFYIFWYYISSWIVYDHPKQSVCAIPDQIETSINWCFVSDAITESEIKSLQCNLTFDNGKNWS